MNTLKLLVVLATCGASLPAASRDVDRPPPSDAAGTQAGSDPREVEVVLQDGQVLRGRLVGRDDATVTIEVAGARVPLPAAAVREAALVGAPHGAAVRDPNRTRYLYSPSAFLLARGEGYVSQTELAVTSVAVGATDWLTVQAGTVLPILFYEPSDLPFVFAAKAGATVRGGVHVAAGLQTLVIPGVSDAPAVGFVFGTLTLGDEDGHVSVSAGPPFMLSRGENELGSVLVSLSGALRVSRSVALVTENWIVPVDGEARVVGSGAVRFIADRLGVDVGLVFARDVEIPIPWLDFTWHWR
jgi:hypothetical protein